ncbi:MAG: anti-anti-sigma regulatory factor [Cellvibrionaceae bacterium]|jgi:anti-anti-sigma regulatory factor
MLRMPQHQPLLNSWENKLMSDVDSGQILVASHQKIYVIKMVGDVRLTLCVAFDKCIEILFSRSNFKSVLFDLAEVKNLDSTTLGFIAKVAIKCQNSKLPKPVVFCHQPVIKKLLVTMGIDEVCDVVDQPTSDLGKAADYRDLGSSENQDEEVVKDKVIEAHEILVSLNEDNGKHFNDLIETLKSTH